MLGKTALLSIPGLKVGLAPTPNRVTGCTSFHLQKLPALKPERNRLDNRAVPAHHSVRSRPFIGCQCNPFDCRTLEMDSLVSIRVFLTLILEVKPVFISGVFGVNPDLIAGIVTDTENDAI